MNNPSSSSFRGALLAVLLGVVFAVAAARAQPTEQGLQAPLAELTSALPRDQAYVLGVLVRPPAMSGWRDQAQTLQSALVSALRNQLGESTVAAPENPDGIQDMTDMAVAVDAAQHGVQYLLIANLVDTGGLDPEVQFSMMDGTGVQLRHVAVPWKTLEPAPPSSTNAAESLLSSEDKPEELGGGSTWARDLAIFGLCSGAGCLNAAGSVILAGLGLGTMIMAEYVNSMGNHPVLGATSTVVSYAGFGLCGIAPCLLFTSPVGPLAGLSWLWFRLSNGSCVGNSARLVGSFCSGCCTIDVAPPPPDEAPPSTPSNPPSIPVLIPIPPAVVVVPVDPDAPPPPHHHHAPPRSPAPRRDPPDPPRFVPGPANPGHGGGHHGPPQADHSPPRGNHGPPQGSPPPPPKKVQKKQDGQEGKARVEPQRNHSVEDKP